MTLIKFDNPDKYLEQIMSPFYLEMYQYNSWTTLICYYIALTAYLASVC